MHDEHAPGPGYKDRPTPPDLIQCARCGSTEVSFRWQTFANGTRHIRVTCRRCCRFIKYAGQTRASVKRANAEAGDGSPEVRS